MSPRQFVLARHEDPSGVSGIGLVAEGVEWTGGGVTLHWLTEHESVADFPGGMAAVLAVHGHNGATVVRYLDETEPLPTNDRSAWEQHDDPEMTR